jgi:glycosyltransferase involved in cell wall biosynthesis
MFYPMRPNPRKTAIVIDALSVYSGAERVLEAVLELHPGAPIYTLVQNPAAFTNTTIAKHEIYTSWLQGIPGSTVHYRNYLPLMPLTVEQFDLRGFDLVLSFSYAVAHGVVCRPDQLHISYTFAPLRYAWQNAHEYFQHGLSSPLSKLILHYLRLWDQSAASRVDHFIAISNWTAACIWRAYRRESEVIYPPVEIDRFKPLLPRGDYYVAFSRLVRHKRIEIIVKAFSKMGFPLVVIGDGPERKRLEALAAPNVKLVGRQSDQACAQLVGRARALVHAAEEDFGLVMAEAQAAGCPVIAYGSGSAREIILEGRTGLIFHEQTAESLAETVQQFEKDRKLFDPGQAIKNAHRFSKVNFQEQFANTVEQYWADFLKRPKI